MRIRSEGPGLRRRLRERMLRTVFARVPDACFDCCLELGGGDGFQSTVVARVARLLVGTEFRLGALVVPPVANTRYAYCDAERLAFRPETFDLILSSHLLEHLPDLPGALGEMRRALRDGGVMVHLVPSRFWKLLDFALFFPSQIVHVIETYAASERSGSTLAGTRTASRRSNVKGRATGWWRRSFWPPVHGVSRSNAAELLRFSPRRWIAEFSRAGFDVAAVVTRLPVHSPYRFGWERARRFLESLGATSSIGYVVVKAGEHPDGVRWLRPQHEGAAP